MCKVLYDFVSSPRFSFSSRAPLYTRFVCVYLYFHPHGIGSLLPFLTPLSFSIFFSSFPPFRAHNCITERLSSQLTLSSLPLPISTRTHVTPEQICIDCSHLQRNGTKNLTEVDIKASHKMYTFKPNHKLERAHPIHDKNTGRDVGRIESWYIGQKCSQLLSTISHSVSS